jgi:hypothetical protein
MLIYIRHSEDNEDDPTHVHDPKLTHAGKKLAYNKGKKLIEKYGFPNIIYCSPFRRTRQTLKYMLHNTPSHNIKIIYDPNTSRYFNEQEKAHVDIDHSTLKSNVPIYESNDIFRTRIKNLSIKLDKLIQTGIIVWCITHTTVYKRLSKGYNIQLPETIPYMDFFIINPSNSHMNRKWCIKCNKYHYP